MRKTVVKPRNRIYAADDDWDNEDDADGLMNAIDDVADSVEDIQDTIDDVDQDAVNIDIDNNISDHYIAECELCKGIFISAVIESTEEITSVRGTCPLCGKDSEQYLKWIIKPTEDVE